MKRPAIFIAYFARGDEAERALGRLKSRGFRRAASLYKSAGGEVHSRDPFLLRRVLLSLLAAAVSGLVCTSASLLLSWPVLPVGLTGGFAGLLSGWVSNRRTQRGITKSLLADHARWLVPDEIALLLQAPVQTLHHAVSLLREGGNARLLFSSCIRNGQR